ncbi:MAG: SpoIIIAH-like family protein [Clostridiales bacterium]|jgi:hypothetical protein|nr:SpoIIIAH-like family protein [Clostridiales bacterium]
MLTKRKKTIILFGMIGLLVITGWLNIMLNNWTSGNGDQPTGGDSLSFFAQYRADRLISRTESRLHLESIINNPNSSPEAIASAEQELSVLASNFETELVLETLIKALGFSDAAVAYASNVNVMVKGDELNDEKANQILHIILNETESDPSTVRLIEV